MVFFFFLVDVLSPPQFPKVWGEEETLSRQSAHLLADHHRSDRVSEWSGFYMDQAGPGLAVFWSLENTDSPNFLFFSSSLPSLVAYAVEIGYHPSSVREKKQL